MTINSQQWKVLGAMLFGSAGPIAWLLSHKLGFSDADAKVWLDFLAALTPLIAGVFITAKQTTTAQVQAVAGMPAEEHAAAVAKLSDEDQAKLAAALPDKAVVTAAGGMTGVTVNVDRTATSGARDAAFDRSVSGVNPT